MLDSGIFIILAIGFTTTIMAILSVMMILFGMLIAKTPDGQERRGEKKRDDTMKKSLSSPEKMPKILVAVLFSTHILGSGLLVWGNSRMVLIGIAVVVAALLFSATIVALEVVTYNMMQKKLIDLKGSIVA
jgi:hypothetical protein